jgi:hypothetical protein
MLTKSTENWSSAGYLMEAHSEKPVRYVDYQEEYGRAEAHLKG